MEKKTLPGFKIFYEDTGERCYDDFAIKDTGEFMKADANGNYTIVPARGEYRVLVGDKLERY